MLNILQSLCYRKMLVRSLLTILLVSNFLYVVNSICSPSQEICEYWLVVKEKLTMTWKTTRVYAVNSTLYKFDETPPNSPTKIPLDEVITMDGIQRSVIAVNESVPGPPLVVYEGQQLIIHVKNHLLSESITIHWHGLHQKDTPFMDGVAYITQCPISAGQSFTYKFKAYPKGTFWYHSHIGGQRVDGLYGALIIKPRKVVNNEPEDLIIHISDWFHVQGSELHTKMISGYFKSQPGFIHPKTSDGIYFAPLIFKSAVIEGRGRYKDSKTGEWTQTPFKSYTVKSGKTYRFRVICPCMIYPFRVSVDNHMLSVVSTDGYDVQPRTYESIIINPGERYDFIITTNQTEKDYWIRADGMDVDFTDHNVCAILRYKDTSSETPTTNRMNCSHGNPCKVLNCQFSNFPAASNTICEKVDVLNSIETENVPLFENNSEEHFMNFVQIPGGMGVDGNIYEHLGVSSLTQHDISKNIGCKQSSCAKDKVCLCQNELSIPFNKTIQMIWTNHGNGATRHHPIHLHGHSFHILKIGYPQSNTTSGLNVKDNVDIDCGGSSLCNNPTWTNKQWANGNIPGLKLKNAPQKDTLMIPAGGYAVIRFKSNNPGKWFLHCHIEFHSMQGMAMVVNEAQTRHVVAPSGFPVCQNFHYDSAVDVSYVKKVPIKKPPAKDDDDDNTKKIYLILFIVLACVVVLENKILLLKCYLCKKPKEEAPVKYKDDNVKI